MLIAGKPLLPRPKLISRTARSDGSARRPARPGASRSFAWSANMNIRYASHVTSCVCIQNGIEPHLVLRLLVGPGIRTGGSHQELAGGHGHHAVVDRRVRDGDLVGQRRRPGGLLRAVPRCARGSARRRPFPSRRRGLRSRPGGRRGVRSPPRREGHGEDCRETQRHSLRVDHLRGDARSPWNGRAARARAPRACAFQSTGFGTRLTFEFSACSQVTCWPV